MTVTYCNINALLKCYNVRADCYLPQCQYAVLLVNRLSVDVLTLYFAHLPHAANFSL